MKAFILTHRKGHYFKKGSTVNIKGFNKVCGMFEALGTDPDTGNELIQYLDNSDFEVDPQDKSTALPIL